MVLEAPDDEDVNDVVVVEEEEEEEEEDCAIFGRSELELLLEGAGEGKGTAPSGAESISNDRESRAVRRTALRCNEFKNPSKSGTVKKCRYVY